MQLHALPAARAWKMAAIVVPSCAGDFVITMPAFSIAFIFSVAPPLPPEMMAPAWPASTDRQVEKLEQRHRAPL